MKKVNKTLIIVILFVVVAIGMFGFFMMGNRSKDREMPEANGMTGEIVCDAVVSQNFINKTNNISEIAVVFSRDYYLDENVDIVIELLSGNNVLVSTNINADDIQENHRTYLIPSSPISGYFNKELTLKIYTTSSAGTGLYLLVNTDENETYLYGNQTFDGTICFSITGNK